MPIDTDGKKGIVTPLAPNVHQVAKYVVIDFLRKTLPFSELDQADLDELAASSVIGFFPRGAIVFEQDITEVRNLYVVRKGAVNVTFRSEVNVESLMDFRGEGSYFGVVDIIRGAKAQVDVETLEDTFCFVIGKAAFPEVIGRNPTVLLIPRICPSWRKGRSRRRLAC